MNRTPLLIAAAFTLSVGGVAVAEDDDVVHVTVLPGEGLYAVARRLCPNDVTAGYHSLLQANPWVPVVGLDPGTVLHWDPTTCPEVTPSSTTTTAAAPTSTVTAATTTTAAPTTILPSTSLPPTTSTTSTSSLPATSTSTSTTTLPSTPAAVAAIPVDGTLPSEATCASQVVSMTENRPGNSTPNQTPGSSPNDLSPRVTGNFTGTTDEIIQWAACKWGLDVDWARAQAALESWWMQDTLGDWSSDPAGCVPGHPVGVDGRPGECPQSIGLLQTRWLYTVEAFEDDNAIRSTAYNADYVWGRWRECFDGQGGFPDYSWLNTVERGRDYEFGDGLGCMGVWFSGRWYTAAAVDYMGRVTDYHGQRVWESANFGPAEPTGEPPATTTTTPGTTTTSTTVPDTGTSGAWEDITPSNLSTDPSSPHDNYGISSIAIDPSNPTTLYVGTNYQGIWKTTDGGDTWFKVNTGTGSQLLDSGRQWALAVDPFNSNIVWTTSGYGAGGPLRSTDGGVTWTKLPAGPPTQHDDVHSIEMDPYLEGHMVISWHSAWTTGDAGWTESFDGGDTWTNRQPPAGSGWNRGMGIWFLDNSDTMLVGSESGGLWRTTNGGTTWTSVSSTPVSHGGNNALLRMGNGDLYMALNQRIERSVDNGVTWTPISTGLSSNYYAAIATDGTYLYTAPYFPVLPGYIDGPWHRRLLTGGAWEPVTDSPNTCHTYNTIRTCNGPSDAVYDSVNDVAYAVNGTGGIWRLQ